MGSMREIAWEEPLLTASQAAAATSGRTLSERIAQRISGGYGGFAAAPWIPIHGPALNRAMFTRVHFDHVLADLVGLVVSQDNSCRYCFAAQRTLMRVLGFPQERITQLEQDLRTLSLQPKERATLEFARRLSRSSPLLARADTKPLQDAGLSNDEIRELVAIVALMTFFNRVSTLAAAPPSTYEQLPDRLWARVLRPFMAPIMRRFRRRAKLEPLAESERTGPFAAFVCALDGLPAAHALRGALDACFGSDILTPRSKALVFAVVARALGDLRFEHDATAIALEAGLERSDLDEILAHLTSPRLDATERIIVPFARETVWYRPAQIQRRAREVQDALRPDQFTELIGVASLANTVGRLGLLVDE